jgi:methenyltetrahydrofolate cyclohydrolase
LNLERFLVELGSQKGAPGGGAGAALTGATGAALVEMTARLNDKRLKKSSGNALRAAKLRVKMHGLIAQDVKAFERIQKIYGKRRAKPALWQSALKSGAKAPLEIAKAAASAAALAKKEKSRTSRWLESDRREALILLRAAFDGARLNVEINLKEVRDAAFNKRARGKLKKWRQSL